MIHYQRSSPLGFDILFRLYGSVIPWAIPRALLSGFVCFAFIFWDVVSQDSGGGLMHHPNPFTFYFQIAAFVLAFHTNQAYNRFWEARTQLQTMAAYWADSLAHLLAFDRVKDPSQSLKCPIGLHKEDHSVVVGSNNSHLDSIWRARCVHLFSLLHAVCISYLLSGDADPADIEVLGAITPAEEQALEGVEDHAFLVSYWITEDMTRRHAEGGLAVPPPIMSRTYQLFNLATLAYNQACKIEDTPFPFPYIQLLHFIDASLVFVTPVVMACWVENRTLSVVLTLLAVGAFHALFAAAGLMEAPFGQRPNDLPLLDLNRDFISRLKSIIDPQITLALKRMVVTSRRSRHFVGLSSVAPKGAACCSGLTGVFSRILRRRGTTTASKTRIVAKGSSLDGTDTPVDPPEFERQLTTPVFVSSPSVRRIGTKRKKTVKVVRITDEDTIIDDTTDTNGCKIVESIMEPVTQHAPAFSRDSSDNFGSKEKNENELSSSGMYDVRVASELGVSDCISLGGQPPRLSSWLTPRFAFGRHYWQYSDRRAGNCSTPARCAQQRPTNDSNDCGALRDPVQTHSPRPRLFTSQCDQ